MLSIVLYTNVSFSRHPCHQSNINFYSSYRIYFFHLSVHLINKCRLNVLLLRIVTNKSIAIIIFTIYLIKLELTIKNIFYDCIVIRIFLFKKLFRKISNGVKHIVRK